MSENTRFEFEPGSSRIVKVYPYEDEDRKVVFEKVRYEPKAFRFRRQVNGRRVYNLNGIDPVPYRLPKWKDASTVIIAEGEKDSDGLVELEFPSTCGPFGAASWPVELTPYFKDKVVYVAYHIGEESNALKVAVSLHGTAREIFICRLPSEQYEFDLSDLLAWYPERSAKIKAVQDLLGQAEKYEPPDIPEVQGRAPTEDEPEKEPQVNNDFLNLWVDSISQVTDAPKVFKLFSGIGLLSGILNKHSFPYPRKTLLNLYILLLAPSTICRKTLCLDITADYLAEINSGLLFPDSFTPEALFEILEKNPRGLIIWRELIQVGEFNFGSEYNKALPSLLTDLYDFKPLMKRHTKGEGLKQVSNPTISILAAGIQSWLISMMTRREIDFMGGIWSRFLFVLAPEPSKTFHLPIPFFLLPRIIERLCELDKLEPKEISLERIHPLLMEWGQAHLEEAKKIKRSEMQANFMRLEVVLLKIAAILQLADEPSSTAIEPKAFTEATKLIDYLKSELYRFFEEDVYFTEFEKARAAITRLLRKHKSLKQGEITGLTRLRAKLVKEVMDQLRDEEMVREVAIPSTEKGGRPGKAFKYTGDKR